MMSNEDNHWITFPYELVVQWDATLPPPCGNPDALVEFGCLLVAAGKRHEVWDPQQFSGNGVHGFESYVREAINERGRIPLLFQGADGKAPTLARVAYFGDGSVTECVTSDVGALLKRLRPDRATHVCHQAPPVTVLGESVTLAHDRQVTIQIRLDTDLWFPQVPGLDEPSVDGEFPDSYDNSELARRHTPRLNAFLSELRECARRLGGHWECVDFGGFARNYRDQWDDLGIRLPA